MAEGYCVKCKAKKEMKDAQEVTMKNGRKAMKGSCPADRCQHSRTASARRSADLFHRLTPGE